MIRARTALERSAVPLGLALLSFALAFAQRPGKTFTDARIELTVDPGLFLDRVGALWSPTTDLGHVQSGQFVGYLFPVAPFYALGDLLGLPMWITQRLWLGAVLAFAAWGVVRLLDALYDPRRGVAHFVAGLLFVANPYVVVFATRAQITLLALATLPWLMLAAHRGLRDPRGWRWPVVVGLLLAVAGGGVNAGLVPWLLVGVAALVVYEVAVMGRAWREAGAFAWRAGASSVVLAAWWAVPVLLQAAYGAEFLDFTEQPISIWATNSMSESVRLLGFWLEYLGIGFEQSRFEPIFGFMGTYLFSAPVVLATFLVPLAAFAGLLWTRRWSYGPFFGLLLAGGLVAMSLGFPPGTLMRDGLLSAYYDVEPLQFLRTTYKAGPLVALALACLGGAAAAELRRYARDRGFRVAGSRLPGWSPAVLLGVVVLWALPLFTGRAVDSDVAYDEVPRAWRSAIRDSAQTTPGDRRTMLLPGELFGWYRWGGTWDSIGPALSERPLLVREITRYADPRASQLQDAVDDLVQQSRLVPGQLEPLLGLMGVGQVMVAADGRRVRNGALEPARVAEALSGQRGFDRTVARYGPRRTYRPTPGRGGESRTLPDLRLHPVPQRGGVGVVRVHSLARPTVVEGDAEGVTELAAVGELRPHRALFYAGDLDRDELARLVRQGARLALTDSNRRRAIVSSRLTENRGPTLGPSDPIADELPTYDLFPGQTSADRTVALYTGLRYLRAPQSLTFTLFPQHRPYAALDGDLDTSWIPDAQESSDRYLELALRHPRRVAAVRLYPHADRAGRTVRVAVSLNGGAEREVALSRGWNRIRLDEPALRTLRVRIARVRGPGFLPGQGGVAELRLPGPPVRESLRLPASVAAAARGLDLSRNEILVLLQRTTADFPYRAGADRGDPQSGSALNMLDAEPGLEREVTLPAARSFRIDGWASVDPRAPDPALDRLASLQGGWRFSSSSRFEGVPSRRASSAFDGDRSTAWVGDRLPLTAPHLSLRAPRETTFDRIRLVRGSSEYQFPSRVRISTEGALPVAARVGRDGAVRLPRRVRTRSIRIDVLNASSPATREERRRRLPAVAVAEVVVPGLRPPPPPRRTRFATPCGELAISAVGVRAQARVSGTVEELAAGRALRLRGCGRGLALPAGTAHVSAPPGQVMRPDHLRLLSPPAAPAASNERVGTIADAGDAGNGRRDHVRLALAAPAWLVLGETYSRGWRAWCRDRDGGERALGAPEPIDGFANGWRVGPECREARFAFAPQRLATASYVVSMVGALLALLLLLRRGARRPEPEPNPTRREVADPLRRLAWGPALAVGAAVGVVTGLFFALRVGAVLGPLAAVLLRDGVSARRLLLLATLGLAAVPVIYLAGLPVDQGGFNFAYANEQLGAHWIAVGAVCCLAAASGIGAWALRRGRR